MLVHPIMLLWIAIVGAAAGSFANVLILRLPFPGRSITTRSRCLQCKKPIRWLDLVPIVSYFRLRGKCRDCGAPFSWRYPFGEFIGAIFATTLCFRFGPTLSALELFIFFMSLMIVAFIDIDTWLIPLSLVVWLMVTGLIFGAIIDSTLETTFVFSHFFSRLLGIAAGFLVFSSVLVVATWIFRKTGRISGDETAMGFGDPLLLGGIGAYLGWQALPMVVLLASLQGVLIYGLVSIMGQTKLADAYATDDWRPPAGALPFGPFLALGAIEVAFWPFLAGQ